MTAKTNETALALTNAKTNGTTLAKTARLIALAGANETALALTNGTGPPVLPGIDPCAP